MVEHNLLGWRYQMSEGLVTVLIGMLRKPVDLIYNFINNRCKSEPKLWGTIVVGGFENLVDTAHFADASVEVG